MNQTNTENSIKIPKRSFFKQNEVCELFGIQPYVLRFWESEFSMIKSIPSETGQKYYDKKDLETILVIKKFLLEDKLGLEVAKQKVEEKLLGVKNTEKTMNKGHYQKRDLSVAEQQKLIIAKAKLQSLISLIKSVNSPDQSV